MENKSYNLRSLRGDTEYDDVMFQQDMRESNIDIPDDVLFKPDLNKFVASGIRDQNIMGLQSKLNPETGVNYTEKEATDYANQAYNQVLEKVKTLTK